MKALSIIKKAGLGLTIGAFALCVFAGAAAAAENDGADAAAEVTELTVTGVEGGVIDASEEFTERDLTQTADLSDAVRYTLADNQDIHITEAGVYVISGTAKNAAVYVEAADDAKVELVLDGAFIENDSFPCIYVKTADKVFITVQGDSELTVTGAFEADGDSSTGGVILSCTDLVMKGTATLTVSSSEHGIVSKDDLKLTGGTYIITAAASALKANDSIRIAGGVYDLTAGSDGIHAEYSEDDTVGYVLICGGELTIDAGDDGIHAMTVAQIDGGTLSISAAEGIEASYVQINGGVIDIYSVDDGINGAYKSSAYQATIEITGGDITVEVSTGDTDGIDCNGDLTITGGTIDVTGGSTFDIDGTVTFTGGTVIVNGQQVTTIPTGMGGFGAMGGRGNRW